MKSEFYASAIRLDRRTWELWATYGGRTWLEGRYTSKDAAERRSLEMHSGIAFDIRMIAV